MPNNLKLSNNVVNPQADALSDSADNGYLRIYDGTQPATADTAITTQVLLAELRFNATAAPAASNGVLTFNAITQDSSAKNFVYDPTGALPPFGNGSNNIQPGK